MPKSYEVTYDDKQGFARFATRKRKDAAILLARKWAYEGIKAVALLDRPIAHTVINAIESYDGKPSLFSTGSERVGYTTIECLQIDD